MLFVFIDDYKYEEFRQEDALKTTICCLNNSQLDSEEITVVIHPENVEAVSAFTSYSCIGSDSEYIKDIVDNDILLCLEAGDIFPATAIKAALQAISDVNSVSVNAESVFKRLTAPVYSLKFVRISRTSAIDLDTLFSDYQEAVPQLNITVSGFIAPSSFDWERALPNYTGNHYIKRNVWAFCAGQYSNDFRGNPKYLFLYLNENRQDIYPYWLCDNLEVIALLRSFGLIAYRINTPLAERAINETGVLVSEFVKQVIPSGLEDAVYLNLWHGVGGVKNVERALTTGVLTEEIAKKYIQKNSFYRTHELYLAPSLFIENIAEEQLGLSETQIIRAGYPRCQYKSPIQTFDHRKFFSPLLPSGVKFAAYIPTYRNNPKGDLFSLAIPDMERLVAVLKEQKICLIFKMHPLLANEFGFKKASEVYKDCPYLYFWDNRDDFYEVINEIDLCIMDYSSMFTDFIAAGCKHFVRYAFDFTGDDLDFPLSYDEATLGRKCINFDELLDAFRNYESDHLEEDLTRIGNLYWEYADKDSFERIVDNTLAYEIPRKKFKTLYSFDIFDTLISRKGLVPESIFYKVRERIEAKGGFPKFLVRNYPEIRHNAELNVREFYTRSLLERDSERTEISFSEIISRIKTLYGLNDEQANILAEYEKEAEIEDVIAVPNYVSKVKELLENDETVILISDMYHDKEFIRQMLHKVDPVLAEIPLFLSSESGYQKSSRQLFVEVYRTYGTEYCFERWIHTGDNPRSDCSMPKSLNIETNSVKPSEFNEYECGLVEKLKSYDAYLIAASLVRFRTNNSDLRAYFAYAYVSFLWVPYLHWALHSCKDRGDKVVYFVSRDGHQFKRIADAIKSSLSLDIETKYIYASRRTWRIPSFFDHIDVGFWGQGYGNVAHVSSFSQLLKGLEMEAEQFYEMFPALSYLNDESYIDDNEILEIANILKVSGEYEKYLLERAEKQRVATCGYLKQEIDQNKQFSIVEYWGRGYTQENFTRLWQYIIGRKEPSVFYYSRSTLPSDEDNIRINYTSNTSSQAFIESIFSCINYKTIRKYDYVEGRWEPVIEPQECDFRFFNAMEEFLPLFAQEFCTLPLTDRENTGRALIDFAIDWHRDHPEWDCFKEILASQVDSVEMFGEKKQYAPSLTNETLDKIEGGLRRNQVSKNIAISYYRAPQSVQNRFREMFQIRLGELLTSGLKLSPENIAKNQKARKDYDSLKLKNSERQRKYDEACNRCLVQNIVLILTAGKNFSQIEYGSLQKALENRKDYTVRMYALGSQKLPWDVLASARYIISINPLEYLSELKLRSGSSLILLGSTATSYFCRGLGKTNKLRDLLDLERLKQTNDISYVQVPSEAEARRAEQVYSLHYGSQVIQSGSVVTDCYFDEQLRASLKQRLYDVFPAAEGKKVIAYAPLYRMRNNKSKWLNFLDITKLSREIGDEYVIAFNLNGKLNECSNIVEIPGFSSDLTKVFSVRELMMVADVIVVDYRDSTFEAALTQAPVFLTSCDHIKFDGNSSIFTSYDEMRCGVSVKDTHDFITYLKNIDNYDWSLKDAFAEKFLTYCDGHSAERLVESFDAAVQSQCVRSEVIKVSPDIITISLENNDDVMADYYMVFGIDTSGESIPLGEVHTDENSILTIDVKRTQEYLIAGVKNRSIVASNFISIPYVDIPAYLFNLEISNVDGHVHLRWNSDESVSAWNVKGKTLNGEVILLDKLSADSSEWNSPDDSLNIVQYYIEAEWGEKNGIIVASGNVEAVKLSELRWTRRTVALAWNKIESADSIEIYRSNSGNDEYKLLSTLKGSCVEYRDDDCCNGTENYILRAFSLGCIVAEGRISCVRPQLPKAPENVMAILSDNGCTISWSQEPDVSEYRILLLTKEKKDSLITVVPGTVCEWEDSEHRDNVLGYKIEAVRDTENCTLFSGYSLLARPIPRVDLFIAEYTRKSRLFKWSRVSSAKYYELYVWDDISSRYILIAKIPLDKNVYRYMIKSKETHGLFQLRAMNDGGIQAIGNFEYDSVDLPEVPSNVTVSPSDKGWVLRWSFVDATWINVIPVLENGKTGSVLARISGDSTEWVDNVSKEYSYGYVLEAVRIKNDVKLFSGYSEQVRTVNQLKLCLAGISRNICNLKWEPTDYCEGYRLFRRSMDSNNLEQIAELSANENSFSDKNYKDNELYVIHGFNKGLLCAVGTLKLGGYDFPEKPQELLLSKTEKGIALYWSRVDGVTSWNIRSITTDKKIGKVLARVNGNQIKWIDTSSDDSTRGYQIESVVEKNGVRLYSGYSRPVLIDDVISMSFISFSLKTSKFRWESSKNIDLYKLYRKESLTGGKELIGEYSANDCSYCDNKYSTGVIYEVEGFFNGILVGTGVLEVQKFKLPSKPEGLDVISNNNKNLLIWKETPKITVWNIKTLLIDGKRGKDTVSVQGEKNEWVDENINDEVVGYCVEAVRVENGIKYYSGYSTIINNRTV